MAIPSFVFSGLCGFCTWLAFTFVRFFGLSIPVFFDPIWFLIIGFIIGVLTLHGKVYVFNTDTNMRESTAYIVAFIMAFVTAFFAGLFTWGFVEILPTSFSTILICGFLLSIVWICVSLGYPLAMKVLF